jgi:hypothetical protein
MLKVINAEGEDIMLKMIKNVESKEIYLKLLFFEKTIGF